jgi:hypothetical protein
MNVLNRIEYFFLPKMVLLTAGAVERGEGWSEVLGLWWRLWRCST